MTRRRSLVVALLVSAGWLLVAFGDPSAGRSSLFCTSRPSLDRNVHNVSFAVWYDDDPGMRAKAQWVLNELSGRISRAFNFMRPPVADINACDDGGTTGIDFYLVENPTSFFEPVAGVAYDLETNVAGARSGFAEVDRAQAAPELGCTTAHEYFHILQFRYGRPEPVKNKWWVESTATWSEHVYKSIACKQPRTLAGKFLQGTNRRNITELNSGLSLPYESWLWPLYVQRTVNPRFVRTVFEGMGSSGSNGLAARAIDDQFWRLVFPDFVLRQFNKGRVNDFDDWDAARSSAKTDDANLSLNGKATKELTIPITVEPASGYHVMVKALDVNTRNLEIDLSDFTRQTGAAVRVLLQPTKGPHPPLHANEWDDAVIENWSTARKKVLCRDTEDEDYQQILIAFSNTDWDGRAIDAKIKLRSEAMCPWKVTAHVLATGSPPATAPGGSASGSFTRGVFWSLSPDDEPVICPQARRACLPLTGSMSEAVTWNAQSQRTYNDPTPASFATTARASGRSRYTYAPQPGPADLQRPVLFQDMVWDPAKEVFQPVLSVMLSNFLLRNGIYEYTTPATTAFWSTTGGGECDRVNGVPDYTYTASNTHGAVSEVWTSCLKETKTYGVNGPLFFQPFGLPGTSKPRPSNTSGDSACRDIPMYAPWTNLSGGPCFTATLDPHATESQHDIGYTAKWPPAAAVGRRPYSAEYCLSMAIPCPVSSDALESGFHDWPLSIAIDLKFSRAEPR